ncbi:hypothetical protein RG47T_5140 [Mucilaginibacter polytrichastri]|uniref:Uncharacterized protein n=1 Tax=Mucilaginibacter polytrichastri TaxID=1302689 RepID=A0A1Q6A6L6_9SPHI|nr:hypothetical protein RG47T_5140 [Mucilaginibacter polytrichastri]
MSKNLNISLRLYFFSEFIHQHFLFIYAGLAFNLIAFPSSYQLIKFSITKETVGQIKFYPLKPKKPT